MGRFLMGLGLWLGLLAGLTAPASSARAPWQGMNLILEPGREYAATFATLRSLGANGVALVVLCRQRGNALDCRAAPGDAEILRAMRQARAQGLRVMLTFHVETDEFPWRGEIHFDSAADRTAWWEDYRAAVIRFAALKPDVFVLGTELMRLSADRVWKDLAQIARWNCGCELTYAAQFDEAAAIRWWDAVDFIGVDAYYPLDAPENVDALVTAWQPDVRALGDLARTFKKPVVLTEVGYQSRVDSFRTPWQTDPAVARNRSQAFAYQAVFEAFRGKSWWNGALFWDWNEQDDGTGFTPMDKSAEGVLLANWRR